MNMMGAGAIRSGDVASISQARLNARAARVPKMMCPVCATVAKVRSSEEISPESRRLYFFCGNVQCGMTWCASLTVERVISPSAISPSFRPAVIRDARPPGYEFGQGRLFDHGVTRPPGTDAD